MRQDARDRVTVDLRGAGPVVHERAAARGVTVAAFVRQAVLTVTEQSPGAVDEREDGNAESTGKLVKVTLRLPAAHAFLLAKRARRADVSQGAYVAGLIDGTPPQVAVDRREAITALLRSTDQLAVISTDLTTFMRLLRQGKSASPQLEGHRAELMSLSNDLRGHLAVAGRFLSELHESTSRRSGAPSASRRT